MTSTTSPYDKVVARLGGIRNGIARLGVVRTCDARCPAHDDHKPSLTVTEAEDGKVLLHCHKECSIEDIVTALGLTINDLFPQTIQDDRRRLSVSYTYTDEAGEILFYVDRWSPKDFTQRPANGRRGHGSMKGVRRVLYRLPAVIRAVAAGETIYVCEGEKDVDAIVRAGGEATCSPSGAGKWSKVPDAVKVLTGAPVIVVADRDALGRAHADDVARSLHGCASSVRIVEAAHGKDAADHLAAGLGLVDLVPVDATAAIEPEDDPLDEEHLEPYDLDLVAYPSPSEPMPVARLIVALHHRHDEGPTLRYWRGGFYRWAHASWVEVEDRSIRSDLYRALEDAVYLTAFGPKPWTPTARKISDVADALKAVTHISEHVNPPEWIDSVDAPNAAEIVSVANGLLHVPTRSLHPHDPRFFNAVACPFDYDSDAPTPSRWLAFLKDLWGEDPEAIATMQEFFGYVISGRTDLHKILLLIGPTRAGKGVIARVLRALVGAGNVAGPTLNSLGQNFGLQPLLGKTLAIISDARLGSGNANVVIERLLSISGEDTLTVDRKYRDPWTGKLGCRFLVISNELPRFGDASGAIANRMVVLTLTTSFLGNENTRLTDELLVELPGILNWALDGLDRVNTNGNLTEPPSSRDAVVALQDIASPIGAFVRDRCDVGPLHEVEVEQIFASWRQWCELQGRRPSSAQMFGRDLRAVVPALKVIQPRNPHTGRQARIYRGLRLRPGTEQ
jgi:putative DNA primase/helicase